MDKYISNQTLFGFFAFTIAQLLKINVFQGIGITSLLIFVEFCIQTVKMATMYIISEQ